MRGMHQHQHRVILRGLVLVQAIRVTLRPRSVSTPKCSQVQCYQQQGAISSSKDTHQRIYGIPSCRVEREREG